MASTVKANRRCAPTENPYRRVEKAASDAIIATLDLYRDLRDAALEALFFQIYGPPSVLGLVEKPVGAAGPEVTDPRELPLVQEALSAIGKGGYPEAVALIGALVSKGAGRITPVRLELVDRFVRSDIALSRLSAAEVRRIKSEQAVIAELEAERGLQSLPKLLSDPADRRQALALLDEAVATVDFTAQQHAMIDRVRAVLGGKVSRLDEEWPDMAKREFAAST
jgi:hypothetical protein